MQYRLNDSLGLTDARTCNKDLGCSLPLDAAELAKGCVVSLTDKAADTLGKKYPALLEPVGGVKGVAKKSDIEGK